MRDEEAESVKSPAIYITVDHHGKPAAAPSCRGCLPPPGASAIAISVPAAYRVVGSDFKIDLCTNCAVHAIKSLAARFVMFDRSATRDLMDFFAADLPRRRPRRKSSVKALPSATARSRRRKAKVIDVDAVEKPR